MVRRKKLTSHNESAYIPVDDLSEEDKRSAAITLTSTATRMGASDEDLSNVLLSMGLKEEDE